MKKIKVKEYEILVDDDVCDLLKNTKINVNKPAGKYSQHYASISFDQKTKLPTQNLIKQTKCNKCKKKSNRITRGLCWNCYKNEEYHKRLFLYKTKNNMSGENKKIIYLHQYIVKYLMKLETNGKNIDHINRNSLDNRRCNLRVVTSQINQFNSKCRDEERYSPNGEVLPRNIYYYGEGYTSNPLKKNPYVVRIGWKYGHKNIGCFNNLKKATEAITKFKEENKSLFT